MPTVLERINVSVDTGDLDQRVGAQVAQLQQVIELVAQLIDDPPDDVGDLLDLAANLPLPEFTIDAQFTTALTSARDALPTDLGDLTAALDGDLGAFTSLIEQLKEILQDPVRVAAAVENLVAIDFSCPGGGSQGSDGSPPPVSNPGADRMTRTAQQTQQVNDMLDRLPPSPTVGGLLEFFFPIIDHKAHDKLFQLTLPVVDDIIEPLRTLSRWASMDAGAVGTELETTITTLSLHLRGTARQPLDTLSGELAALEPQLALPALTTFGDAYAGSLDDLVAALEGAAATGAPVSAINLALDDAAATLTAWDGAGAADLEALCPRLHDLSDSMLDRLTHLLTLLEPVELPSQLVGAAAAPQPPDAAVIAAVQQTVQPMLDWLNELLGLLDFSALQGEVGGVASEAQQIANAVEQGLTGVALQVQSLFDGLGGQLGAIDLNGVRDQLNTQIEQFGANVEREIGNAFSPAGSAIDSATQSLSDAIDAFDPGDVVDALRSVLQAITGVLESGEIANAIDEVRIAIATTTETLEQLSFAPVTDEVIALIEQMRDALAQLGETDLNEAAKAALSVALEVLPDDLAPVTDPLLEEFDQLIDNGPVPLLERVAEKPAELLDSITRFQPGTLIGDALGTPYRKALDKAEAYQPSRLFAAIDDELQRAKQSLVQQAAPGKALGVLSAPFDSLKDELNRYSPDALLLPLEEKIEAAVAKVIEASPVDEIFNPINRVFELITQTLDVPRNLVATLQRLDALLTRLANSGQQIDTWRDGMLDKVFGVTNLAAITAALSDLDSALADAAHAALLSRFDSQTLPLRTALESFGPGTRVTTLVGAHNRARSLANALPDSVDKSASLAALDRFDPSRAPPLRLSAQLLQCLDESRDALVAMESEWRDLVESPDGLLTGIAAVTRDANGLRSLVATALEPLLAPLRHLFSLIESVQPALQAMLSTLSGLVDQLTSGVAALVTGPASLQSISDAIQQVVDTLRNIDLGFLRESLQQLFIQLLDQLDALDPAQLGQALDDAFSDLLEPIGLDQVIPPGSIDTLDASFQLVLDKLRALDPEQLITEVVQPEYEATLVPLVEAFDLTPAFNALIEFLRGLSEELGSELDRVNGAYQGLSAARPELGSINVNISL